MSDYSRKPKNGFGLNRCYPDPELWAVEGIYCFSEVREGREYPRYIGQSSCLYSRVHRGHEDCTGYVRVLVFEEDFLTRLENYLIGKYNPPRNIAGRIGLPHEWCTVGRPLG
jgi:hypothetical protein